MNRPTARLTPLCIIAAFLALIETTVGYVATKTTGGLQTALAVFVIVFASAVLVFFFMILWHRPYVFYSPAEYGDVDPRMFAEAMRGPLPPRIAEQVALVRSVEENPDNKDAQFQLVNSLIDPVIRQHLILMYESKVEIPYSEYSGHSFALGTRGKIHTNGVFGGRDFVRRLGGTKFVDVAENNGLKIRLTEEGGRFASWLICNDQREAFMETPFGGWGEPFSMGAEADRVTQLPGSGEPTGGPGPST